MGLEDCEVHRRHGWLVQSSTAGQASSGTRASGTAGFFTTTSERTNPAARIIPHLIDIVSRLRFVSFRSLADNIAVVLGYGKEVKGIVDVFCQRLHRAIDV